MEQSSIYKNGQSRLDFLMKIRSFKVYSKILQNFYKSDVKCNLFTHYLLG